MMSMFLIVNTTSEYQLFHSQHHQTLAHNDEAVVQGAKAVALQSIPIS